MTRGPEGGSTPVVGDDLVATLAGLDVLEFDLAGNVRPDPVFMTEVRRELRALRARADPNRHAGSESPEHVRADPNRHAGSESPDPEQVRADVETRLEPALRRAVGARAEQAGAAVDVPALARELHARFPVAWRTLVDGFG